MGPNPPPTWHSLICLTGEVTECPRKKRPLLVKMLFSWRLAWYLTLKLPAPALCDSQLGIPVCEVTASRHHRSLFAPALGSQGRLADILCLDRVKLRHHVWLSLQGWSGCSDLAEGLGRTEHSVRPTVVEWSRPGRRWPALTLCHHLPCHHINHSTPPSLHHHVSKAPSSSPHPSYPASPEVANLENKSIIEQSKL